MSISHGNDHAAGAANINDSATSPAEARRKLIEREGDRDEDVALDALTGISGVIEVQATVDSLYLSIAKKKIFEENVCRGLDARARGARCRGDIRAGGGDPAEECAKPA